MHILVYLSSIFNELLQSESQKSKKAIAMVTACSVEASGSVDNKGFFH